MFEVNSLFDSSKGNASSYNVLYGEKKHSNRIDGELLEVAMGPQHPSTHGVFRMDVQLDGEIVTRLKPVFGYLHRNQEKIAESISYLGVIPYTDRLDYLCSMTNNWAYVAAVEKLTGIVPTERAEYVRVIVGELTRLLKHFCAVGFLVMDLGAMGTPSMYSFREREKILDLFQDLSGSRMMCNYFRFGGCRTDVTEDWLKRALSTVDEVEQALDEFDRLITGNEIVMARLQNVGKLSADLAVNAGMSGCNLRASGVNYDLRKARPYGVYNRLDFLVPLGKHGDCYDRMMMRFLEARQSIKLIRQAIKDIPEGSIMNPKAKQKGLKPDIGHAYAEIEAPKGILGFYLVSDNSGSPYRCHVRAPSFINLTVLEDLCIGTKVADVIAILGSLDILMGEVDR